MDAAGQVWWLLGMYPFSRAMWKPIAAAFPVAATAWGVDRLLHENLRALTSERPQENRSDVRQGLGASIERAGRGTELLERLDALEVPWTPPARTGFEPDIRTDPGAGTSA